MNIAIDWDDTFTSDPIMWQTIINTMYNNGHSVYIVTSRSKGQPIENHVENVDDVIYCSWRSKKEVTEKLGIVIHIWIDDNPKWIIESING